MKNFIQAERTGDWNLHLQTLQSMLPYFHATGHNNYTKFDHIYLQDMYKIEEKMNVFEHQKFTEEEFFTVRCGEQFCTDTWSVMTIEH